MKTWVVLLFPFFAVSGLVHAGEYDFLYDRIAETTVVIKTVDRKQNALAAGIYIGRNNVLTNAHLFKGDRKCAGREVLVKTKKGKTVSGMVTYCNRKKDIARIRLNKRVRGLKVAVFRRAPLAVGEKVFTTGHPRRLEFSFLEGDFGRTAHPYRFLNGVKYLHLDLRVTNGNSGGSIFDIYGNVVGLSSKKYTKNDKTIALAIRTDDICGEKIKCRFRYVHY